MDDLHRLFARYRVLLLITAVTGAAAAVAVTLSRGSDYSASATMRIQDVTELEGFNGSSVATIDGAPQLVEGVARTATSDSVLRLSLAALNSNESVDSLSSEVSASLDPSSDLLVVTDTNSSAARAAQVANVVATTTATVVNAQSRSVFSAQAAALEQRIAQIPNTAANRALREHDQENLAQLQTLSIVGAPAKAAQRADIPTARGSRKTGFYGLLGAVLGLLVGIAAAFAREAFDRGAHSVRQVSGHLGLPVLAQIEADALGDPRAPQRPGRTGTQIGLLRRGLELLADPPPRHILLTSSDGDAGQSELALALGRSFARTGRSAVLIDADLHSTALTAALGAGESPGLSELLLGSGKLEEMLEPVDLGKAAAATASHVAPLSLLPAGAHVEQPDELLASGRISEVLEQAAARFDVTIIAAPPLLSAPDALEILPYVDACLICVRAGETALPQLDATRELLARLPARPAAAAITGISRRRFQVAATAAAPERTALSGQ